MFYAKSTGGFYDPAVHGSRKLMVVEPSFIWPQVEAEDGVRFVNDPTIEPPMLYVDNPNTKIPSDAVELTIEEHSALIAGQAAGKLIVADENGFPILQDLPKERASNVWERIKTERDHRTENGGYRVGTKWFHSDQKSRLQQLGLVLLGVKIPANLQWKTMDGSFVTVTQQLVSQMLEAAAVSDQAVFAAAETHKAAMEASPDPGAYDFSGCWPTRFGD